MKKMMPLSQLNATFTRYMCSLCHVYVAYFHLLNKISIYVHKIPLEL